jgi:hypothetical protein
VEGLDARDGRVEALDFVAFVVYVALSLLQNDDQMMVL